MSHFAQQCVTRRAERIPWNLEPRTTHNKQVDHRCLGAISLVHPCTAHLRQENPIHWIQLPSAQVRERRILVDEHAEVDVVVEWNDALIAYCPRSVPATANHPIRCSFATRVQKASISSSIICVSCCSGVRDALMIVFSL